MSKQRTPSPWLAKSSNCLMKRRQLFPRSLPLPMTWALQQANWNSWIWSWKQQSETSNNKSQQKKQNDLRNWAANVFTFGVLNMCRTSNSRQNLKTALQGLSKQQQSLQNTRDGKQCFQTRWMKPKRHRKRNGNSDREPGPSQSGEHAG